MLSVMPEPAATIFAVAAFTGLRRSELQGLRWEDYKGGQIRVARSIWEGHISDPKTSRSKGAVPVIKQVADRLEFHRLRKGNPSEGPMFPNKSRLFRPSVPGLRSHQATLGHRRCARSQRRCARTTCSIGRFFQPCGAVRLAGMRRPNMSKRSMISGWMKRSQSGEGGTRRAGDSAAICMPSVFLRRLFRTSCDMPTSRLLRRTTSRRFRLR